MPTWSEILGELRASEQNGIVDFDGIRRKYLKRLHEHTQRDVILYASGWLQNEDAPALRTSIVDDTAKKECADPAKLAAWLPMLSQFGPDLLERCETALKLSKELVHQWLETYMFAGHDDGPTRAQDIANWLADHKHFKSHSRHLPRAKLRTHGMDITDLEADEELQDRTLSVFHATTHTLAATAAVKIVENHEGRAFIKTYAPPPPAPAA